MNKKSVKDSDVIAAIAQKELDDLARIDGAETGGASFKRLKQFFKKHLKREENGKLNAELEEDKISHDITGTMRR